MWRSEGNSVVLVSPSTFPPLQGSYLATRLVQPLPLPTLLPALATHSSFKMYCTCWWAHGKSQKLEGNGINNEKAHPSLLPSRNPQCSVATGGHLCGCCCYCGDRVSHTQGSFLTKRSPDPSASCPTSHMWNHNCELPTTSPGLISEKQHQENIEAEKTQFENF